MASARFSRAEDARLCRVAQTFQFADDLGQSQIDVTLDVLKEHPSRATLVDDPGDLRPEVPWVVLAPPMTGDAEGLAGVAGSDEMNSAAPWSAVEGSKVVPDSSLSQGLVAHPGHESGRRVGFPLDVTHSPIVWLGDVDAEVEAAVSGAEGEPAELSGLGLVVGI
jgi:hypothetical protein